MIQDTSDPNDHTVTCVKELDFTDLLKNTGTQYMLYESSANEPKTFYSLVIVEV